MEFMPQLAEPAVRLHLLVVDADAAVRSACAEIAASLGYAVESTGDLAQARSLLRGHTADILLVNLPAGSNEGLEMVSEVKLLYPETSVIAMTATGSVNAAVEAMRCGASDYLTKPFAMDELSTVLDRAAQNHSTDTATRQLRERLRLSEGLGSMIGRSAEMEKIYRILSKVAQSTHPVLILGESGTGKELVARTIHAYGPNGEKPFLPVDCGSIVPTLIESELFGYVRGAFTGANRSKDGLLVSAEGGTVFLDEIGELSLDLQAKLLRALQEKEVRPVGATHRVPIKARIVAATNRDLAAMVEKGSFRKDLFYRLNVVNLRLPRTQPQVHALRRGPAHHDAPRLAGQRARARERHRARLRHVFGSAAATGRPAHSITTEGLGSAQSGSGHGRWPGGGRRAGAEDPGRSRARGHSGSHPHPERRQAAGRKTPRHRQDHALSQAERVRHRRSAARGVKKQGTGIREQGTGNRKPCFGTPPGVWLTSCSLFTVHGPRCTVHAPPPTDNG
jgi:FixJ family two-component response regulator